MYHGSWNVDEMDQVKLEGRVLHGEDLDTVSTSFTDVETMPIQYQSTG